MVRIIIDDLNPNIAPEFIEEVNSEDTNNIQGGIRTRREPILINRRGLSTGIESLDSRIDSWQNELNQNYEFLRKDFDF